MRDLRFDQQQDRAHEVDGVEDRQDKQPVRAINVTPKDLCVRPTMRKRGTGCDFTIWCSSSETSLRSRESRVT